MKSNKKFESRVIYFFFRKEGKMSEIKKEDFNKIINQRYSVKEAFAYFIAGFRNIKDGNYREVFIEVVQKLIDTPKKDEILEQLNGFGLNRIKNSWNLDLEQVMAYAFIVFEILVGTGQNFCEDDILLMFIFIMRLYSPNNAIDFVNDKYRKYGVDVR